MYIESTDLSRRRSLRFLATAGLSPLLTLGTTAWGQSAPPPGGDAHPLTGGQGEGYHSPLSPFAPLPKRDDVIPWSTLAQVEQRVEKSRVVQVYAPAVLALNQKTVRLQGFMSPLDPGERQVHFLLTSVPLTCAFCTPGGAESIIQVRTRQPIRYTMEGLVVEGRFHVLQNDTFGFYYRLTDAVAVK